MKLSGKPLGKAEKIVVFERPDRKIVFNLSAVLSTSDFEKIYPPPEPQKRRLRDNQVVYNTEDPRYIEALKLRNDAYVGWLVQQTLATTPELTWEKVKAEDANTWRLWREELLESGLSPGEVRYLESEISAVNALNDERLEAARATFLLEQARGMLNDSSSPPTEQQIT